MNILLIGSGGREHALALALHGSPSCGKLFCAPGNPGIFNLAEKADINPSDFDAVAAFCGENDIKLVVVGPENPLAEGIADELTAKGIKVFGPVKNAAMLEASKGFAKEFMKKYNIPTAAYETFPADKAVDAHKFIDEFNAPVVLKADGLAAGKGVIIPETKEEAHKALDEMFAGLFGDSGKTVVIEEFMDGEEASVLAVADGKDFITLAPSQDHKRALDGDIGPNTGGMGAYVPAPVVTDDVLNKVRKDIISPAIAGMQSEGSPFIGCLYAGLMIKNGEPRVVEFNVRFGDPETEVVLPVFEGDFAGLLYSAANGELDKTLAKDVCMASACTVIMASDGYPGSYDKGYEITGIDRAEKDGGIVFQAGTSEKDGKIITSGGRVLSVTALGSSLSDAVDRAYYYVDMIDFENAFYRRDIAKKGLEI